MAVTVISSVGTSLLTNRLRICLLESHTDANSLGDIYPETFLNCLNREGLERLEKKDWRNFEKLISIVRKDKVEKLADGFLKVGQDGYPREISAETNSLRLLIDHLREIKNASREDIYAQLRLYFITTNTPACRACAHALKRYYQDVKNITEVVEILIERLTTDPSSFDIGVSEFTNKLVRLINEEVKSEGNMVFLNATGGFKPEVAYMTLCGLLNQVEVFYAHEGFEDKLVFLPQIPLGFGFAPWHLNAFKIQFALKGNRPAYDALPEEIKRLMDWDEEKQVGRFNHLGEIFWVTYQNTCIRYRLPPQRGLLTERIKAPVLNGKISKFIDGWDHIWVGMQVPQMLDHTQAHCQNLLILAEQLLLPMEDFLTEEELYVLIACIWLHDIGHCEPLEVMEDGSKVSLSPDEIRSKHHLLTYQLISNWPQEFGFPYFNEEAKLIATICKFHRKSDLSELPLPKRHPLIIYDDTGANEPIRAEIRPQLIAALLRLVDACDMGIPRAGSEAYVRARTSATKREQANFEELKRQADEAGEEHYSEFLQGQIKFREASPWHFKIHQKIAGVEIKPEKIDSASWRVRLIVHPERENDDIMDRVLGDPINMERDINAIKDFLRPYITEVPIELGEAIP